ncbi:CRP-like cAMP-binding protein [Tumebacillus sp. BK434]|uniref:Crp/Fnr family transcriptional regulator n=1 Tax=Tumebacillus sp. BK434 TaxID=2512169 RepID=UPI001048F9E0|nr:cyclic nucleotide-binding domain-containing protein [Tumebacillus sp. BK434]TCP57909.1 CRP-like cAMP-binding protein [Tumebacillus sp. BK434]
MEEMRERGLLMQYLERHEITGIFNERLLPHVGLYRCRPGELLCRQGEAADTLYVLVDGKVKIYTTSAEGKTLILSFKTPLEVIGDLEYVQGAEILNTVEAVTDVHVLGVQHRWLHQYAQDDAKLLQFLLDIVTKKFLVKSQSMSFNIMYPVEVRLASYLLLNEQTRAVSLKDAANLIGTSYRHLNRVLRQFCTEGLVERQKGLIVVKDREALGALASEKLYE